MMPQRLFGNEQQRIYRFCAECCAAQESGELSVARMLDAWDFAYGLTEVTVGGVLELGSIIEPDNEVLEWRQIDVLKPLIPVIDWREIPSAMESLVLTSRFADPGDWVQSFLTVHPFIDGNGRIAEIIYNWLRGTMEDPSHFPRPLDSVK